MRKLAAWAAMALSAVGALAADVPAPIRAFDIATIEALGRQIYRQDQEAWKASDVQHLLVARGDIKKDNARGWVVSERGGRDVVRFVRLGANGPESYYDVVFESDVPKEMGPPKNAALSADEIAQWNARMLAISKFEFRCTAGTPNTVAIRETNGNWLVWVLSASANPDDVILAGHMRFTISADGKSILQTDKLSNGCMVTKQESAKPDYKPVGAAITNLVSLKPLETQVFTSLNYKTPLYVGTLDGMAWKLDGGHAAVVEQDAPKPDGDIARHLFGMYETCLTLIVNAADGSQEAVGGTAFVVRETEQSESPQYPAPAGRRVISLICRRMDIVPSPNDYKVLRAGYGLYIEDRGQGHAERAIVLWLDHGRVVWRFEEGPPLTAELKARIEKRADQFQEAIDAKP